MCKQYTTSSLIPDSREERRGMGWLGSWLYELHCSLCHAGVPKKSPHEPGTISKAHGRMIPSRLSSALRKDKHIRGRAKEVEGTANIEELQKAITNLEEEDYRHFRYWFLARSCLRLHNFPRVVAGL